MSKEQSKAYAEQLKASTKELIDGIGTDSEFEIKAIKLIYGFVRRGFLKCKEKKEGAA